MNAPQQVVVSPDIEIKMQDALKAQRESYLQEGFVSAETRIDRLNRAIDVLVRHADRISEAINKDFVCRPCLLYTSPSPRDQRGCGGPAGG